MVSWCMSASIFLLFDKNTLYLKTSLMIGLSYYSISNSDDEEWFYNGSWDDGGKSEEDGLSNDEDSNGIYTSFLLVWLTGI